MRRTLAIVVALFVLVIVVRQASATTATSTSLLPRAPAYTSPVQATAEPDMMFDVTDRLAPPPMSDPPTQVEQGHYAYYLSCMVCHGDRGQGFTDEWRGALDPADQNCWQSKCHAANHPPEGFELPRYAPPVIGPGRLAHHQTAAGLYQFLRSRMPWQAPGILSDEEYWQLTAFLAQANGISWGEGPLGPDNAANVALDARASSPQGSALGAHTLGIGALLLVVGVLGFASGIAIRIRRSRGPSRQTLSRRVLHSQIDDSEGS